MNKIGNQVIACLVILLLFGCNASTNRLTPSDDNEINTSIVIDATSHERISSLTEGAQYIRHYKD